MTVGKSKAKIYVETNTRATFEDVAGVDDAKEELREIVAFLGQPKEYGRLGARVPMGVLQVGPPGTDRRSWILPCCAPDASTARSWWTAWTRRVGVLSSRYT